MLAAHSLWRDGLAPASCGRLLAGTVEMWVSVCSPGPGPEPGKEAHPAGAAWGPTQPQQRPRAHFLMLGQREGLAHAAHAISRAPPGSLLRPSCCDSMGYESGWLVTKGSTPLSLAHFTPRASRGWADLEGPSPIATKPPRVSAPSAAWAPDAQSSTLQGPGALELPLLSPCCRSRRAEPGAWSRALRQCPRLLLGTPKGCLTAKEGEALLTRI